MFYKRSSVAEAIESEVLSNLSAKEDENKLDGALSSLAQAADLFETGGMDEEAEALTQLIERVASGEFAMIKEAKKKAKKKKKSDSVSSDGHAMVGGGGFFRKNLDRGELAPTVKKQLKNLSPKAKKKLKEMQNDGRLPRVKASCECDEEMPANDEALGYEKCASCGFDHAYEPDEAFEAHFPTNG